MVIGHDHEEHNDDDGDGDLQSCWVWQLAKPKVDATKPMYSRTLCDDDGREYELDDDEEEVQN